MNTFTKKSITAEAAKAAIAAAAAKARQMGLNMCIAITDESGDLKAFLRMDGAAKLALDIAQNKAYTAVSFGMSTDQWWDFIKEDPPLLHGITHTPRLVVFGGGYPIKDGDQVVGAIGVSGGHYTQDMEVAKAGVQAVTGLGG
ncbi:MAG TPA: heme-binding protein [Ramlibacter sp.]|nr:heme-binding protein [Ramlibacter sp.]